MVKTSAVIPPAAFCVGTVAWFSYRFAANGIEVIDAKQRLLWVYEKRGPALSTEEAAQAARWEQDMAAWNGKEAASIRP